MPLFNREYWDPSLHPRNSVGEFIYTDGGRKGKLRSKSAQANTPAVGKTGPNNLIPLHPPGADINRNMRIAWDLGANQNPAVALRVFYLLVKTGGPWDYKNQPNQGANPQYDAFGNFNYGATGTAFGLTPYQLRVAAGLAQPPRSGGSGLPFLARPYGDRSQDEAQIDAGIAYAHSQNY